MKFLRCGPAGRGEIGSMDDVDHVRGASGRLPDRLAQRGRRLIGASA
jgi:hypothetical protein